MTCNRRPAFAGPAATFPLHSCSRSMPSAAQRRLQRQTLTLSFRTFLSVTAPSRGGAGGAGRDRTDDLMLAKQPLSQLSYSPNLMIGMRVCRKQPEGPSILVGLGRLERPTSPLSGVRSNHLSYRPRAGRLSHGRCMTQQALSEPAIRMRKRNEDGLSASRQSKP